MKVKRGFTLIELMVVITIIALLIMILLPGLAKALELARRAACQANLDGIGTAVSVQKAEKEMAGGKGGYIWANATDASVAHPAGAVREQDPWDKIIANRPATSPPSVNMYGMIHKIGLDPDSFVCPSSAEDEVDGVITNPETGQEYWDFLNNLSISYSFQAPLATGGSPLQSADPSVIIMADQNPIGQTSLTVKPDGTSPIDGQPQSDATGAWLGSTWDAQEIEGLEEPDEGTASAMTNNHKGEYTSALKIGGEVTGNFRADIGYNKDCIWTPSSDAQFRRTATFTHTAGSAFVVTEHTAPNDSFLIDTQDTVGNN